MVIEIYFYMACAFGFLLAWGIGANDVANAMGTSVGSGTLKLRQALFIAIIFECLGALLAGGEVTQTLRKGLIDTEGLWNNPSAYINGMSAALLASAVWLMVASYFGWPVSTTHTIVGAIVGFGWIIAGPEHLAWEQIGTIALSWVCSPLLGGVIAYGLFWSIHQFILDTPQPFIRARRLIPVYIFFMAAILIGTVALSGLAHIGITLSNLENAQVILGGASVATLIGIIWLRTIHFDPNLDMHFHFTNVERLFGILMIFTACSMAFAHGSNDVANAIGPLAGIVDALGHKHFAASKVLTVPLWITLLGCTGLILGLLTFGHKVMATIGTGITELTPSRGFAATLACAITVVLASGTGLPISTTHTLVGAILGIGLARGIGALDLRLVNKIFLSWIITLPIGAGLCIGFYAILSTLVPTIL